MQRIEAQPLRPILTAAIAAKRGDRDVQLLGDASVWARVDAAALEQAVGHLVQNARRSLLTDRAGDGSRDSGAWRRRVDRDHRQGRRAWTADFVRNRLFQPFASTKPSGFGIGAFEARSLVAAMGGRLGVDSRPGKRHHLHHPAAGRRAGEQNRSRKRA